MQEAPSYVSPVPYTNVYIHTCTHTNTPTCEHAYTDTHTTQTFLLGLTLPQLPGFPDPQDAREGLEMSRPSFISSQSMRLKPVFYVNI